MPIPCSPVQVPPHRNCKLEHVVVGAPSTGDLRLVIGIDQEDGVEVTVSNMPNDRSGQAFCFSLAQCCGNAVGKLRDWDADVAHPAI